MGVLIDYLIIRKLEAKMNNLEKSSEMLEKETRTAHIKNYRREKIIEDLKLQKLPDDEEINISVVKSCSLQILLYKIAKKYQISLSDALREGVLLLLHQKEDFKFSDDKLETIYRGKGIYFEKQKMFIKTIETMSGGKNEKN